MKMLGWRFPLTGNTSDRNKCTFFVLCLTLYQDWLWHVWHIAKSTLLLSGKKKQGKGSVRWISPGWCSSHSHLLPHIVEEHGCLQQMSDPLHVSLCGKEMRNKPYSYLTSAQWFQFYIYTLLLVCLIWLQKGCCLIFLVTLDWPVYGMSPSRCVRAPWYCSNSSGGRCVRSTWRTAWASRQFLALVFHTTQ